MDQGEKNKLLESFKSEVGETEDVKETSAAYILIGLTLAVIVCSVALLAFVNSRDSQIATVDQQIQNEVTTPLKNLVGEKKQSDDVLSQISVLTGALSKKLALSQMLKDLSAQQYKLARWVSLSYSQDKVTITAQADSFEDVLKTYNSLKTVKSVKSAKLISANINDNTKKIEFTMEFSINSSAYLPVVTATTTTTASSTVPLTSATTSVVPTVSATVTAQTTSTPDILNTLNNNGQ